MSVWKFILVLVTSTVLGFITGIVIFLSPLPLGETYLYLYRYLNHLTIAIIIGLGFLSTRWKKAVYIYAVLPGIYIALRLPVDIALWLVSEVP